MRYHLKFLKVNHRNLASTIFDHVSIDCFWYIVTLCYQTIQISVITVYSLAPFKGHWILGLFKQPFSNDSMLTFLAINGRGMNIWYQHYPFFNINCRHLKKGDLLEMWTKFTWETFHANIFDFAPTEFGVPNSVGVTKLYSPESSSSIKKIWKTLSTVVKYIHLNLCNFSSVRFWFWW